MPQYGSSDGTYGVAFAGTSFTPTLGTGPANEAAQSGVVYKNGLSQHDIQFNRMLRQNKNVIYRELLRSLLGAAPGAAGANIGRFLILGNPLFGNFSAGIKGLGQLPLINRLSTVSDQTNFNTMFNYARAPVPYVGDSSGNGGGGKIGT